MPRHIFDNNVLKNFLLPGQSYLLSHVCPGQLCIPEAVKEELNKTRRHFLGRSRPYQQLEATASLAYHAQQVDAAMQRLEFQGLSLMQRGDPTELELLTCLLDEDRIHAGEIECLVLAVCRGCTIYSDDTGLRDEVKTFNSGTALCLPGETSFPGLPITMHSTIWLLIEAIGQGRLDMLDAGRIYDTMVYDIGSNLPPYAFKDVITDPEKYW